jgi:hypothetical protein
LRAVSVLLLCLSVAGPAVAGQNDKVSGEGARSAEAEADIRAFAESFYADSHVAECCAVLDSLRQRGRRHVYADYSEVLESEAPELRTSSGILMVYTVVSRADTLYHHFSVSRAPYLATAFGRTLVGLACLRLGLPAPLAILLSPMQVFHAEWHLTPEQHAALIARAVPPWPEPISHEAARALVLTSGVEIERFDVDYDDVRRLRSESSN